MVFRTCRRVLRDNHEAQDAFQATFLVLARKSNSIQRRECLGPWLHGVACRVAACARASELRRRRHERRVAELALPCATETGWDDASLAVHEEIDRLPDRFRLPVVLCCLEGMSREQAAVRLGWPVGTVQSRLARGRTRLSERLIRRGIAPGAAVLAATLSTHAEAAGIALPATLVEATIRSGMGIAAIQSTAGMVPVRVAALMTGVIESMLIQKIKVAAAAAVTFAVVGLGIAWGQVPADKTAASPPPDRFNELERKLDRVLEALGPPRADRPDPRASDADVAIAEAELKRAKDRLDWAQKNHAKGFLSAGQVDTDQVGLMKAQAQLDRAKWVRTRATPDRMDRFEQRLGDVERRLSEIEKRLGAATKSDWWNRSSAPEKPDRQELPKVAD